MLRFGFIWDYFASVLCIMLISDCTLQSKYPVINFSGFHKHFVSVFPSFVFKGEVPSWTSAS